MRLILKDKALYISNIILRSVPSLIANLHFCEKTNEIHILINNNSNLENLLLFFKNHSLLQFKSLQDIFGVDYIDYIFMTNNKSSSIELYKTERYQINYYLLSILTETRILLKLNSSSNVFISSASTLFNSASWLEREIWDLFGIFFKNHPDLRRILTDYGFEGHALRKDFPLSGYTEILYTTELKKISVKPLELTQEYRAFDFVSPWDVRK